MLWVLELLFARILLVKQSENVGKFSTAFCLPFRILIINLGIVSALVLCASGRNVVRNSLLLAIQGMLPLGCEHRGLFRQSYEFSLNLAVVILIIQSAYQLNLWNFAEGMTIPGIRLESLPHIVLEALFLYCLPEVTEAIGAPLGECLIAFHLKPEASAFTLESVFLLKGNLKDLECLCNGESNFLLAKPEALSSIVVVIVSEIVISAQKLSLLDTVGDPAGLVDITLEEMLRREWVAEQLDLVREALMEFTKHPSVLFDQGAKFLLLVLIMAFTGVRNVENFKWLGKIVTYPWGLHQ